MKTAIDAARQLGFDAYYTGEQMNAKADPKLLDLIADNLQISYKELEYEYEDGFYEAYRYEEER